VDSQPRASYDHQAAEPLYHVQGTLGNAAEHSDLSAAQGRTQKAFCTALEASGGAAISSAALDEAAYFATCVFPLLTLFATRSFSQVHN
jgi:hypothetical protein